MYNIEELFDFTEEPISLRYLGGEDINRNPLVFLGEHVKDKPEGFIRLINTFGNIYEGKFTPDFKINGFCVSYLGSAEGEEKSQIHVGWYLNNIRFGNFMSFRGSDLKVIGSGWYHEGKRVGEMKESD